MEHQAFEMNVTLVTLSVGGADSVTRCWCRRSARTWPRTIVQHGGLLLTSCALGSKPSGRIATRHTRAVDRLSRIHI